MKVCVRTFLKTVAGASYTAPRTVPNGLSRVWLGILAIFVGSKVIPSGCLMMLTPSEVNVNVWHRGIYASVQVCRPSSPSSFPLTSIYSLSPNVLPAGGIIAEITLVTMDGLLIISSGALAISDDSNVILLEGFAAIEMIRMSTSYHCQHDFDLSRLGGVLTFHQQYSGD